VQPDIDVDVAERLARGLEDSPHGIGRLGVPGRISAHHVQSDGG